MKQACSPVGKLDTKKASKTQCSGYTMTHQYITLTQLGKKGEGVTEKAQQKSRNEGNLRGDIEYDQELNQDRLKKPVPLW